MTIDTPFARHLGRVRPEWIDYNGHMNVAYYVLAFDEATDTFYDWLGIGKQYKDRTTFSTFTLEGHITYDREILEGHPFRIKTYLLNFDRKRIHYFHEMYHEEEGYLASTNELISIHIDMSIRRSAPIPDELLARLEEVRAAHAEIPVPANVGRIIGLKRPKAG